MRHDLPEVPLTRSIQGYGTLHSDRSDLSNVSVEVTWSAYDPEATLDLLATTPPESTRDLYLLLRGAGPTLEFRGRQEDQQRDLTIQFWAHGAEGNRLRGEVVSLDFDVAPVPTKGEEQWVSVRLTPTPIALPEVTAALRDSTGEIRIMDEEEDRRDPQSFRSALGEWKVSKLYEWERVSVAGTETDIRIPVPTALLHLKGESCVADIPRLITRVEEELEPYLTVLSFLSRRMVRVTEVAVATETSDEAGSKSLHESRRIHRPFSSPEPLELLVWPPKLPPDALAGVTERYINSPYKEPVYLSSIYLIAYWRRSFIEDAVATAFRAFEAIVNGISRVDGTQYTVDEDQYDALEKVLRKAIKASSDELGLEKGEDRHQVYKKFPELRRRSLIPRAVEHVERWDVEWQDLFPHQSDLAQELRSSYARRSELTHQGRVAEISTLRRDASRVHALTERLLCRILEVPESWSGPWAYQYAQWRGED